MKKVLSVLYFPIKLIISLIVNFLTFLLGVGGVILFILMLLSVIGALAAFINHETKYGIFALIFAFLLSPIGLPLFLAKVLAFIAALNEKISEMLAD